MPFLVVLMNKTLFYSGLALFVLSALFGLGCVWYGALVGFNFVDPDVGFNAMYFTTAVGVGFGFAGILVGAMSDELY